MTEPSNPQNATVLPVSLDKPASGGAVQDTTKVRVNILGEDTRNLDFVSGKTVGDYVKEVVELRRDHRLTLNGETVEEATVVEPGPSPVIVVAGKIANG